LLTGSFLAEAQNSQEKQAKTLFNLEGKENGGFGAMVFKPSVMNGDFAMFTGIRGGWIIDHTVIIGYGAYDNANEVAIPDEAALQYNTNDLNLKFSYNGFEFEYIQNSDNVFHYSYYTLIGWGRVSYQKSGFNDEYDAIDDHCFVVEPSFNTETNISTWMRFDAGVSYRYVAGAKLVGLNSMDLSGPAANIAFKFGKF
jgi:hypothetical protein